MKLPRKYSSCEFVPAILLLLILPALAIASWTRPLDHDEQQFVASGALLARYHLLPYVDYPYFHLPNLVFIFAGLFLTNGFLLLTARSFNVVCAWLLLLLFFALFSRRFRILGDSRWVVACGFVLVLAVNPLFRYTAGLAWNHDLPILVSVAALALLLQREKTKRSGFCTWLAGGLLGLAVGTRLSFLPLALPFVIIAGWRGGFRCILLFLAGFAVACLPALILMATGPRRFLFDTFVYNGPVNLAYRQSLIPSKITLKSKELFAFKQAFTVPSNGLLCFAFALYNVWPLFRTRSAKALCAESKAILLLLPFLFLGAWMPTPSYRQYYYSLVPFLFWGVAAQLAHTWTMESSRPLLFAALAATFAVGVFESIPDMRSDHYLASARHWPAFAVHHQGVAITDITGEGPVLTLCPIYPLEGGAAIYKEFATGPFAWRTAPFVAEEDKDRALIVDADDLIPYLSHAPPRAVLTGFEDQTLEHPLVAYAQSNGYKPVKLIGLQVAWIKQ